MRKIIITLVMMLMAAIVAAPGSSRAAFDDATLTTDAVLSVGGVTLNITGSSAVVSSITVDSSSFSFVLESGSSLQVTSPDGKVLTTDSIAYVTVNTCSNSSNSVLKHASTGNTTTVTITPQAYRCGISATNSGSGVSGGGGGGGGGGYSSPTIYTNGVEYVPGCPTGFICTLAAAAASAAPAASQASVAGVSAVFSVRMAVGSESSDVTRLQRLLASDKAVYPEGRVTGYFGPLTRKAVENFQVKYGVAQPGDLGFGTVGPMTRAALKKVYGGQ